MGVWIAVGRAGEPVGEIVSPPFAQTLPDDEADVGVEDRTEKSGFDLFANRSDAAAQVGCYGITPTMGEGLCSCQVHGCFW